MTNWGKFWGKISGPILVRSAAACLLLLLAGCGAPAAFLWASLAIDVASVASTGKTPGEHMLSAVVQQDCAVHRLVTEGDLCAPVAVAAGDLVEGAQETAIDPAADPYGIDLLAHF